MDFFVYLLKATLLALFSILEIAMLVRAVMSWFADPDNVIFGIAFFITEPVIMPVRLLCDKFGWFEDSMIDIPFIIVVLLLPLLETIISLI